MPLAQAYGIFLKKNVHGSLNKAKGILRAKPSTLWQ